MENKELYHEKMTAKLKEWNAQIAEFSSKAEQAKADAKIEYQKKVDELQAKRAAFMEKMDELKDAGEDAWQQVKAGVEKAASSVLDALDRAKSSLH